MFNGHDMLAVWFSPILVFKFDLIRHLKALWPHTIYHRFLVPFSLSVQAEFQEQLIKLHERARMREEEVEGGWYTEERMEKDLGYSKILASTKYF